MTQDEFEKSYAQRSGLPREEIFALGFKVALLCACGEDACEGWAAVRDTPLSIKSHNDLYAPKS